MKKKLIAINLNEFNLKFLKKGSTEYNCKNISRLLKLKNIKTITSDNVQNKNLDPWVQSVSINTGMRSKKHRIFNLGEKIPKNFNQIWDISCLNKVNTAVWGPMNINFKNSGYLKLFFPDPWNYDTKVKPAELKNLYKFIRSYAMNYTNFKISKNLKSLFNAIIFLIKKGVFFKIFKYLHRFLIIFLKEGLKSYYLFFLLDIFSVIIFTSISKKKEVDFSLIFLNSVAHYQHNYWDKKNHKNFYILTDILLGYIFNLCEKYNSLIIYNSFSQDRTRPEYIIRPINFKKFLKLQNIDFIQLHSNMTNGVILTFKDKKKLVNNLKKIKLINFEGFRLFETKKISHNKLFCRVFIRSKKRLNHLSQDYSKYLFYEKKIKKDFYRNRKTENIVKLVKFIKTTGKHNKNGNLFFKNIPFKEKKINNIKIFNVLENILKKN